MLYKTDFLENNILTSCNKLKENSITLSENGTSERSDFHNTSIVNNKPIPIIKKKNFYFR